MAPEQPDLMPENHFPLFGIGNLAPRDVGKVPVLGLIKFGQRKRIEALRRNGNLRLNTLSYFRGLEKEGVGDTHEGLSSSYQSHRVQLAVEMNGKFEPIPGVINQVQFSQDAYLQQNIFCIHAILESPIALPIDERNFKFGERFAAIVNFDLFLQMLGDKVKAMGHTLQGGLVQYVARSEHHGTMGCYRKFDEYAYQCEYRFVVSPGTGAPLDLELGCLKDAVVIGRSRDLNSRLQIEADGRLSIR